MKRDMNLVKQLLLYVENNSTPGELLRNVEIDDYSNKEISYHIKLLVQSGLLEGRSANIDQLFLWYAGNITWQGHEFLSAIRNETVWSKIKSKIKDEGGAIPFNIIKTLAIKYSEELFL